MKHLQFIAAFLLLMGVSYSSAAQSFSDPVQINADLSHVNSPSAVHVLDIDGDGDEDVLVASVISQSLGLFRNNGDATFGHEYLSQGKAWYAVSSTDWDGDGNLDVVGVRVFGNIKGIEVFHNLAGNGPADQFDNADIVNAWPYSAGNDALQVGDVDEDGNPEIYHFGNDGDEGGVLIAERVGDQVNAATYKVDLTPGSDNETYDGFLMDGNGDGSKDFFLNRAVNAQVFWIAFNGTNINGLPVADVTTTYEGPAFCCSAGPKLASSSAFTTTGNQGSIKHWQYNGLNAGDGSDWTTETALSGNGFNAERAQTYLNYTWVDVDGDGNKDLLIGDPTNDTILYWPNNGNADFGDAFTIGDSQILATNIAYPSFLDFVDLNGDNAKDILFVDSVGDQLFWLESQVAPAAETTTITANPIAITADGQSTSTITVQAKDANGNNLAAGGDAVVLATTLGALGAVADNNDGTYTATLTAGVVAGTATITGTINGAAITDDADVAFNVGAAAAATTTITANPIAITADGQSTSTITVQAKDANGNNLAAGGDAVVLATTLGALGAVADNNDGTYTATLTAGVVAGTATITGTINGAAITDDADVAFNVGAAAAATTTITANPIAITADGQSTSTITVQAKDANGNNLAAGGDAVVLATTLGALGAVADNNDGTYTATLTAGVVAGTATITGTINGAAITDDADVAFNVGAAAAATTTITANPIAITADGQSTSTITVQAKDANGNNLAAGGDAVVLATTLGALGAVADNNDGTYTATLTAGVVAGTATITGTINGAAITDDADVAFNVGAAAAATTTITANPIAITADGQSTSTITVQAKDANGNNLQGGGDAVVLATTLGALGAVADNNDGTYTATLTAGVVAGTATITGTINGAAITDDADVAFNVGAAAAATTTITANPIAITADGQSTSTITVQAKDANGNNLAAGGDAVVLATTLGALGAVADNGDGTYTATLTSANQVGDATITGTINGAAITDDATVAMQATAAAAATTTITANPIAITADGQSTSTITVQAKDANGNNLQGGGDAVVLATTLGALGAVADNGDGTYTATLTAGVVAGTATITGTINGAAITDDAGVAFNVGAAAAATTTITANPIAITADGQSTSTITVQAKDANGNNLAAGGDAVVLATTLGALGAVADNGDGTYTATLTSANQVGDATITGTINGAAITDDATVAMQATAAAAATTTITANPIAITADGQSTSTITVQAKDANGNNLQGGGDAVVLATTLGALGAVADNGDGTYTATLTAGVVAGTATITGTINGAAITDDAGVAFNVGAAAAATTTITANPIAITADGQSTSTITVQAKDANGNNLQGGGDAVVLATTLGALGAVADNNDGTYTATLTAGVVAGTATITGTINGAAITDDADVAFNVGAAAAATTTITANPIAITADGQSTSTITVQAKDANGNNLQGGGDAVVLATTLGALGAVADNNDGTYTATLTSANQVGNATITGTINGAAITDDADVAFNVGAAAAATTTITANPIAITADGQSTSTITVQAKDANGNNLQGGGDAVVLATTLGALGAVADNNDGTYTATLTAGVVAGTATITGTINGAAITDDADVTLNVGAAGSSVSLVQTSTTPDGDSVYTITIAVTDSDGNNVGTGGDDVSIASTVGVVSEVIDNQDGTYTATLTTSPQEGMAVITITVNGADNSTSTEVTLGPGDANAGRTTISANPLSIVADGQSTSTITIQAKDADGHNLADGGDAVVLATTLGSLGSVVDNLDGTYTATLTAGLQAGTAQIVGFINSDLISSTAQISFTEPNSAPVAVIEASVTSGRAPLEVILDGHSSSDANGDLLTYEWDLGDGTSSQEILITHIFEEGIFDVLLVVSDGNLTDSASVIIEVDMANIAPEAVITASSYVGQAPFLVDFSASASSDANGDSLGFSWDMGDGATRIGESVSHTYGAPGLFTVVLTVTDGSLSDNAEAEISVASGVSVEDSKLPAEVVLKAIYPNPFNLTTMVTYGLPSASKVRITATDLLGRQVATLVAGDMKAAGYHTVQLNADGLASGTYLILIEAGDFVASQQVVLLK